MATKAEAQVTRVKPTASRGSHGAGECPAVASGAPLLVVVTDRP